jgi:hypothetical protein
MHGEERKRDVWLLGDLGLAPLLDRLPPFEERRAFASRAIKQRGVVTERPVLAILAASAKARPGDEAPDMMLLPWQIWRRTLVSQGSTDVASVNHE